MNGLSTDFSPARAARNIGTFSTCPSISAPCFHGLSGNRLRRLHTSGAVVLLPVIAVMLAARHASLPVAAGLSPNGELPHRLLRGPRSQFGRLTVLPRPGQPFPRSLAQERGFLPVRRRKVRRRNRTGVRQAAQSRPGIRSPDPYESLSSCLSEPSGPSPVSAGDALVPAARSHAAGMFFAPNALHHVVRCAHVDPLSLSVRRWFPIRRIPLRANAPRD